MMGFADELLALACTEDGSSSLGGVAPACGNRLVDRWRELIEVLEDPDARPYLWDLED